MNPFVGIADKDQVDEALLEIKNNLPVVMDDTAVDFVAGFAAALMMLAKDADIYRECETVSDHMRLRLLEYRMKLLVERSANTGIFTDMNIEEGDK